jgi:hypothetical protein
MAQMLGTILVTLLGAVKLMMMMMTMMPLLATNQ